MDAHGSITDSLDRVLELDCAEVDLKASIAGVGSGSSDENGYILDAGLRGLIGKAAEYSLAVLLSDFGMSATGLRVCGRYHFSETQFSVGPDYVQCDNESDQSE